MAVEIDPVIIEIPAAEFDVRPDERTTIMCADAADYAARSTEKFDLIIIDLFIDNQVPEKFLSVGFWTTIKDLLRGPGAIIFNTINSNELQLKAINKELGDWGFDCHVYERVEKINTLFIAKKR
jgi:spermidine synthase